MDDKNGKVTEATEVKIDNVVLGTKMIMMSLYIMAGLAAFTGGRLIGQGNSYGWLLVILGASYIMGRTTHTVVQHVKGTK